MSAVLVPVAPRQFGKRLALADAVLEVAVTEALELIRAGRHIAARTTMLHAGHAAETVLGKSAPTRRCVTADCNGEQVEGGLCIQCRELQDRLREWWS